MIEDLNKAIADYRAKWQQLVSQRKNQAFFEELKPTAVCWKAEGLADFDKRLLELRKRADHVHLGWINERWLATIHPKDEKLEWGVQIIKLFQRRPGSIDATGLDHLDFFAAEIDEDILADEPNLKWSHESNTEYCSWISLWFAGTEAKLRTGTTIDIVVAELKDVNREALGTAA